MNRNMISYQILFQIIKPILEEHANINAISINLFAEIYRLYYGHYIDYKIYGFDNLKQLLNSYERIHLHFNDIQLYWD